MARHHYVPQFLLYRWAPNGLINSFSWNENAGKVLSTPVAVRKVCQIEDLNAFYGVSRDQKNLPEDKFFTPQIDTPANNALLEILKNGVDIYDGARSLGVGQLDEGLSAGSMA